MRCAPPSNLKSAACSRKRAEPRHIEVLPTILDGIAASISDGDVAGYVQGLDAFYEALCEGSGNAVARRILSTLHARITYLRTITAAKASEARENETLALMRGIAEAAQRRNEVEVSRRCRAFVERSAEFALQVLAESDEGARAGK